MCGDHLLKTYETASVANPAAAAPFVDFPINQVAPPTAMVATEETIILETKDTGCYALIFLGSTMRGSSSIRGFYTGFLSSTTSTGTVYTSLLCSYSFSSIWFSGYSTFSFSILTVFTISVAFGADTASGITFSIEAWTSCKGSSSFNFSSGLTGSATTSFTS